MWNMYVRKFQFALCIRLRHRSDDIEQGYGLTKWESWNFIEQQWSASLLHLHQTIFRKCFWQTSMDNNCLWVSKFLLKTFWFKRRDCSIDRFFSRPTIFTSLEYALRNILTIFSILFFGWKNMNYCDFDFQALECLKVEINNQMNISLYFHVCL